MGCCGGASQVLKSPPRREPYVDCPDGTSREFNSVAWIIINKKGIDPCSVTGTGSGGLVTRQDAERA